MMRAIKAGSVALACAILAGCANNAELREARPLGAFELGFNVVVADNAQTVPGSRTATEEELEAAISSEIERRFLRYDGGRLYHLGINVDGYVLAPPGIPILLSPKSALIVSVNVWDDALGEKLTENAKQFTVLESLSTDAVVGSGFTMTAEEQLLNLAQNASAQIETWLSENPDWFDYPVITNPFEEGMTFEVDVTEIARGTETGEEGVPRPIRRPASS
ncbi:hypothetical protein [Dinoroseobacter sp. S76]|uniref:hypothetical protein n=1 Tax=Dinoroseobacter sp. S76 TaxID=3415124 RepID=UPI003C7A58D6